MNHSQNYNDWKDIYNWKTCKARREKHGRFLMSILTSETNGHVLNLNGDWGTGKTEFLKRLYVSLTENNHPVIYIDAWESDFTNDPLNVVCSEILNQLSYVFNNNDQGKFDEIKGDINKLLNRYISIQKISSIGTAAYKAISGDPVYSEELDLANTLLQVNSTPFQFSNNDVNSNNNRLLAHMLGSQTEVVSGMKEIRKQITAISEILERVYNLNVPIIVLVDELDRCRPDYAIKTLEVIKHFFDVKGCNFLVATDTNSLQESIKAVYGSNFNSERYLRRFFNQRVTLKRPSIKSYLELKNIDFKQAAGDVELIPFNFDGGHSLLIDFISKLLDNHKLELRDIEKILQKIVACLNYVHKNKVKNATKINFVVLSYGIVFHNLYPVAFDGKTGDQSATLAGSINKEIAPFITHNLLTTNSLISDYEHDIYDGSRKYFSEREVLRIQLTELYNVYNNKSLYTAAVIKGEFLKAIQEYHDNPERWLMWEDYQSLIGLSDAIE